MTVTRSTKMQRSTAFFDGKSRTVGTKRCQGVSHVRPCQAAGSRIAPNFELRHAAWPSGGKQTDRFRCPNVHSFGRTFLANSFLPVAARCVDLPAIKSRRTAPFAGDTLQWRCRIRKEINTAHRLSATGRTVIGRKELASSSADLPPCLGGYFAAASTFSGALPEAMSLSPA